MSQTDRFPPLSKTGFVKIREAVESAQGRDDPYLVVEGDHLLEEALRSGLEALVVIVCPDLWSAPTRASARRLLDRPLDVHSVPPRDFTRLAPTQHPSGILALVGRPAVLDVGRWTPTRLAVIAAGIQDPGNLGTVIRAAEAFEAEAVLATPDAASAFNPKVIRASAGSVFRMPFGVATNLRPLLGRYRDAGVAVVATDARRGTPLPEADVPRPAALILGAEAAGVPKGLDPLVDIRLRIPVAEPVDSLNVGAAAAVILYALRGAAPGG